MEFNFSLKEVLFLKGRYGDAKSCDILQRKVLSRVTKKVFLSDLIDGDPLDNIINSLNTVGCCFIGLLDSANYSIKRHYFTLFKTPEGIFRLEAYSDINGSRYGPRIVEWPTFEEDLKELV